MSRANSETEEKVDGCFFVEFYLQSDCGTPFWSRRLNSEHYIKSGRRKADWDNDLGIVKSKMKIVKVPGEHEIV